MLTSEAAKLFDFGLAQQAQHYGTPATAAHPYERLGTPEYSSPERLHGDAVDGRSDVFSFGVVLYEMLAGRTPFVGVDVSDIIDAVLYKAPKSLMVLIAVVTLVRRGRRPDLTLPPPISDQWLADHKRDRNS